MSKYIFFRLAVPVVVAAFALPLAHGQSQDSQSQSESVADAARRAREQKKAAATKPSKVVDDDTLKPASATAPETNPPAAAPAQAPTAAPNSTSESVPTPIANRSTTPAPDHAEAAPAPPASTSDAEKKKQDDAALAGVKQQLAEAQKVLDLLQRELALQQDAFYTNPDHDRDISGKAKLDDLKQQVLGKQQSVDDLKAKLAALIESLGIAAPAPAAEQTPPQS
jgi:uncharacterized coiled-coil protein SlyX